MLWRRMFRSSGQVWMVRSLGWWEVRAGEAVAGVSVGAAPSFRRPATEPRLRQHVTGRGYSTSSRYDPSPHARCGSRAGTITTCTAADPTLSSRSVRKPQLGAWHFALLLGGLRLVSAPLPMSTVSTPRPDRWCATAGISPLGRQRRARDPAGRGPWRRSTPGHRHSADATAVRYRCRRLPWSVG